MNFNFLTTMLLALTSISSVSVVYAQQPHGNSTFSALFAFGDSILDTGNNNNLLSIIKCNFPPYGRNFEGAIPTGRWGNGRVFSDMIAEGLGLKYLLPAYRDPMLSDNDIPTGVCFASGGSGLDTMTAAVQRVISIPEQLTDFQNYITKLNSVVNNQQNSNAIISNAVFLISAGNNDLGITYFSNPIRNLAYSLPAYTDLMVSWTQDLIKNLYDLGARKFAVMGTLPLGCLPAPRSNFLNICALPANLAADMFNQKLSAKLNGLTETFPGAKFVYVDMYNQLLNIIDNPQPAGFMDGSHSCCCTLTSPLPCLDPAQYVFWDAAHPTENSYKTIAPKIIQDIQEKLAG